MADQLSTFAGLANDAPNVYISRKMIELLDRIMVVQKIAEAYPLVNAMSKTLRAVRALTGSPSTIWTRPTSSRLPGKFEVDPTALLLPATSIFQNRTAMVPDDCRFGTAYVAL